MEDYMLVFSGVRCMFERHPLFLLRIMYGRQHHPSGNMTGCSVCKPHTCHHCGANVDTLATHGLSCRQSEGRHFRHSSINDLIHCALSAAKFDLDWSLQGCTGMMGRDLMASQWPHGSMASCCAQLHMQQVPPVRQV